MEIAIFYSPFPDKDTAQKVVEIMVREKLIACGNIINGTSIYEWSGSLASDNEYIVIMKTVLSLMTRVEKRLEELHPYDIPAIINWKASANKAYVLWVESKVLSEN
ncbi:MAG: divalent-cation tolerance protein CutA [Saprospiraceae bacterium]|nr:divalent-cation tolerance protein CutA [Saprospiraceae bacterium]